MRLAVAARRCTVQLAYAIGAVSLRVETHGTGAVGDERIERALEALFDLTPAGIIAALDLLRPLYRRTAAYGHFGREDEGFAWERTPKVEALRALADK